ncbi:hypothetical protein LSA01_04260 [Latilactobacillus sakei]|nr:hypothetical protein LACBS_01033 [Latilactobacillus sakei subsp. sakei DSM 20017 = JCM 1157]GEA76347.1 hypothetical protein LSA01_04260 [Latilactobacillus sakei]GEL35539.1 hypothetical protein LSA02_02740 [Latilactobacillus sakei subsp. sakei]
MSVKQPIASVIRLTLLILRINPVGNARWLKRASRINFLCFTTVCEQSTVSLIHTTQ